MQYNNPTYKIVTLGCPVNQSESSALETLLQKHGLTPASYEKAADIYIINSCAVTKSAARKSRKEARQAHKKNPKATIAVIGCYSQLDPEEVQQLVPEAEVIIGTSGRSKLTELLRKKLGTSESKKQILINKLHRNEKFEEIVPLEYPSRLRPVVKIQEGCDEFCAYCAVVLARGKPRSRDPKQIVNEVSKLAEQGYREIVLAGTHIGLYGRDLKENLDLPDILQKLEKINHHFRIRVSSLEPMGVTNKLLKTMASSSKICPSLYLPLQSGSNKILKKMNRRYTVEDFSSMVYKARKLMPSISIAVDLIVGFPGEEKEDHCKTIETVRKLNLSHLHIFSFSPRPETKAAAMKDQVRPDIIKSRAEELDIVGKDLSLNFNRNFLNSELDVLVEKIFLEKGNSMGEGISKNYVLVRFPIYYKNINRGNLISVKVKEAHSWGVYGTPVLNN